MAAEQKRRHPGPKGRRGGSAARPRGGRPARSASGGRGSGPSPPGEATEPAAEAARVEIPDDVSAIELSGTVRQQLKSLPDRLADLVGRHLVMAGRLVDDDPAGAHQHALAARGLAARVGVVREACGETAYAAGQYAEALAELRAARRMTGSPAYLPIMADCERALGRPERAVRLSREPAVAKLEPAGQAEMTIVAAGARRDMGQLPAALQLLESAARAGQAREPWVVRVRYAYADALEAAERIDEALEWFHRAVAADDQSTTDAAERAADLEARNSRS